jgi:hypothetical protein
VIDVATLIPQHDDEGRSATILPGVPLPEWALPAGPIAPEPDPADAAPPEPVEAPAPPAEELVMAGAPAFEAAASTESASAYTAPVPLAEGASPSAYGAPLPIGSNGPGPMRAGWDYPGSDFREQAHDEAVAEAADAALAVEAAMAGPTGPPVEAPLDAELALALTAPVPQLEPLPLAEPVGAAVADLPAPSSADSLADPAAEAPVSTEPATDAVADEVGDATSDEPSGSSRRTLVVLGAVGAVAVAGAVAAFVWPGFLVASDPAPVPVVPSANAPVAAAPVPLTTPASVGPYTKLTGAPATALTDAVTGSALPGLSTPVSAVYGTGTTPAVTVIAWNSANPVAASAIPSAFVGFQGATSSVVTDITTTPVSANGEMRCGTTVVSGAPASLCFWADESTFGSVTVLRPATPESAADTAVAVRAAVVGG